MFIDSEKKIYSVYSVYRLRKNKIREGHEYHSSEKSFFSSKVTENIWNPVLPIRYIVIMVTTSWQKIFL